MKNLELHSHGFLSKNIFFFVLYLQSTFIEKKLKLPQICQTF